MDSALYFNQPVVILNSTSSSNATTGAFVLYGGLLSQGVLNVSNTAASTNSSNGAMTVAGGVGISGSLNVGVNASVTGALSAASVSVTNASANNATIGSVVNTNLLGTNATITNSILTNASIGTASLTNVNVSTATIGSLLNTNLINTTATVGTLLNTNLIGTNASIGTSTLTNANVTNSSIANSVVTNASIGTSTVTNSNVTTSTIGTLLNTNLSGTNATVTNVVLSNANVTNSSISNSIVTNASIGTSTVTNSNVTTSTIGTLINTNLIGTNASIGTSTVTNSNVTTSTIGTLINTNLIGTNASIGTSTLTNANVTNSSIANSVVTNASIGTSTVTNSNVTTSTIGTLLNTNLSGTNATVTNAILSNANVTTATVGTLLNTNLIGTNSTIANILNTNVSSSSVNVSGCVISRVNAAGFNSNFSAFPIANESEASIAFFNNTAGSVTSEGNVYVVGHNVFGSGNRTFGIGTPWNGSILTMYTSGTSRFNNNLEVVRSGTVPSLLISGGITGGNGATVRLVGAGLVGSSVQIDMSTYNPGANDPTSRIRAVDEDFSSNLLFQTKTPGAATNTLATRMYINNDGKVGINTTTPAHQLDVVGTTRFSGASLMTSTLGVSGVVSITNATGSASATTGALLVSGGVGIVENLNVGGNAVIGGNLSVLGTTTTVNTETTTLEDNLLVLNAGPAGLADGGVLIRRFLSGTAGSTNFAGFFYKEDTDEFTFATTSSDPGASPVVIDSYLPIRGESGFMVSTQNATGVGTGGSLTVLGGGAISRDLYVGQNAIVSGSLTAGSFFVTNLQATAITTAALINTNASITNASIGTATITNSNVTTSTIGTLLNTNLSGTNATVTNVVLSNANVTTGTIGTLVSGFASVTNISNSNSSISNLVNTTATVGTLLNTNLIGTNASIGTLLNTNLSSTNTTVTNAVLSNANVTTATIGTLLNTNLIGTNSTITNILNTNISSSSVNITTATIGTLLNTNLINTSASVSNAVITNIVGTNETISNSLLTSSTINNSRVTGEMTIFKNTVGFNPGLVFRSPASGNENYAIWNNTPTGSLTAGSWLVGTPSGATGGTFQIGFANTTYALNIMTSGNVGIGIATPSHRLHVEGGIYANTTSGIMLNGADRPIITRGWDTFTAGNYAGAGRWGLFMEPGATTLGIPAGGVFRRHAFVSYNADSTINTTMMTIHENGNVGIGTDPGLVPTHRLSVSGGSAYISGGITAGTTLNVNTVNMTPNVSDIFSQLSFTAGNNVTSGTSITGLSFNNATVRAFDANIAVNVVCSDGNRHAIFNVKGVQRAANNWTINTTFVGDNNTGVTFSINTSGSLQYTSSNIPTYTSSSFSFKANTITV